MSTEPVCKPRATGICDIVKSDFPARPRNRVSFIATFVIMMLTWIVLSGKFDAMHLGMGVISSLIVSWFSSDLLFTYCDVRVFSIRTFRFVGYIAFLLKEIFIANIYLLYLAFHPRLKEKIDPRIVKFQSDLCSDLSAVTLGNSITLPPGTVTVDIETTGIFTVHAIDRTFAAGLPGSMRDKVARLFEEE